MVSFYGGCIKLIVDRSIRFKLYAVAIDPRSFGARILYKTRSGNRDEYR